mmetsp:Transcript_5270/g.6040  ORF Transcript_5270/g.6040 Transcript_5270/m.6040 type:complete len:349 (+) Transcript_5270:520-1566(+)
MVKLESLKGDISTLRFEDGYSGNDWQQSVSKPNEHLRVAKRKVNGKDVYNMIQAKWGKGDQLLTLTGGASACTTLIVWDASVAAKQRLIIPENHWQLCSAIEKEQGKFVACGGLHNWVEVYSLDDAYKDPYTDPVMSLRQHDGYIADLEFVNGSKNMITASGDSQCILWEIESGTATEVFSGHDGDVVGVTVNPTNPSLFASGGIDNKIKLWDIRTGKSEQDFNVNTSDGELNYVAFHPNGNSLVGSVAEFGSVIFDAKKGSEPQKKLTVPGTYDCSMSQFSKSGRLLFTAYEDGSAYAFDIMSAEPKAYSLNGTKKSKIKGQFLDVHPDGYALALGDASQVAVVLHF